MPAIINTNISSLNAQRNLDSSQNSLSIALQRLSSGLRINSAKDDAAGLAIAERFTAQIRGNTQAARNANDGISLAQTAEGDLVQIGNNLQRIRELAVQSANATNSASDRAALQAEAGLLIAEIDRVAANSAFNGVKLLDGSFTAQQFQVGANGTANDRITLDAIASARISVLGASTTYSTTLASAGAVTSNALADGDLVINGIGISAATAGAGAGQTTDSAYAKAAAINALSADTNVTATAGAVNVAGIAATTTFTAATPATVVGGAAPTATKTQVTGAAVTDFVTPGNGDITGTDIVISGVAVGSNITGGGSALGQATNLVAAINGTAGITALGITASVNATNDGINLRDAQGDAITVTLAATATLANTGLTSGTNQAANVYDALSGTDLVVGGNQIVVTETVGTAAAHAAKIETAIELFSGYTASVSGGNVITASRTDGTNFTVTTANDGAASSGFAASTTSVDGVAASNSIATLANGDVTINGVSIGVIAAATNAASRGTTLAAAINSVQSTTGVTATAAASGALSLTAADGRNITIAFAGAGSTGTTGLTAGTTRGTLTLASTDAAGITIAGNNPAYAGFSAGTTAATATGNGGLNLLTIATVAGSNAALATIDAALTTVNSSRATLGAVQNRFASTVASLQTTVENLSASRSRIQDADFAAETAALSRSQILQQAGTAILAQANASSNSVLSLLR